MNRQRQRILDRRARFLAAAVIGGAVLEVACEAQACLSVAPVCDSDPQTRYVVEGPNKMCTGDRVKVRYVAVYCGSRNDVTADATFTSSNPGVVALESGVVRGLSPGRATITGIFSDGSGMPASLTVEVRECSDAASDALDDG